MGILKHYSCPKRCIDESCTGNFYPFAEDEEGHYVLLLCDKGFQIFDDYAALIIAIAKQRNHDLTALITSLISEFDPEQLNEINVLHDELSKRTMDVLDIMLNFSKPGTHDKISNASRLFFITVTTGKMTDENANAFADEIINILKHNVYWSKARKKSR